MRADAHARPRHEGRPPEGGQSCRPSDRGRQLPLFWRSWRRACVAIAVLVAGLALPGCQSTDAPANAATEEEEQSVDYPPLQTVPPRPQLSYTVQQQRQIVEALIADRENARYTDQVIRYRSGLSSLPPPPTPPAPVAVGPVQPAAEPSAKPEPPLTEQETLADFLRALRRQFQSDEPEPAPPVSVIDAPSPESAGQAPMPPARSAVAARLAERPDPVGQLLDDTVAQAPLPPDQSAVTARLAATDQARAAAPLPAPRPATLLAPPPTKPVLPVSAPTGRRPVDGGSASGPQVAVKAMS